MLFSNPEESGTKRHFFKLRAASGNGSVPLLGADVTRKLSTNKEGEQAPVVNRFDIVPHSDKRVLPLVQDAMAGQVVLSSSLQ